MTLQLVADSAFPGLEGGDPMTRKGWYSRVGRALHFDLHGTKAVKFKLDENFRIILQRLFTEKGHDCMTKTFLARRYLREHESAEFLC